LPRQSVLELAHGKSQEVFAALMACPRVRSDRAVLDALLANHELDIGLQAQVTNALAQVSSEPGAVLTSEPPADEDILAIDEDVVKYLDEHKVEIAAEEAKGFELTELTEDEKKELQTPAAAPVKEKVDKSRMSPLQRISQMSVGERVQLAMKGNKEERYILIRDGSKVVSSAVLESPKLTDQEIEMFAAMKNVQESVLRTIAGKRKFMKLYPVMRALTANPRCPLDVGLPIMKSLLVVDLRNLSMNKNVPDTLRKVAFKLYKERSASKKSD